MIVVFWMETRLEYHERDSSIDPWTVRKPYSQDFKSNEMMAALKFMEELRQRRKAGEKITHVCMQSELPEAVGEAGVSDKLPADYNWHKRRPDPTIPVGRKPTGDDIEVPLDDE